MFSDLGLLIRGEAYLTAKRALKRIALSAAYAMPFRRRITPTPRGARGPS